MSFNHLPITQAVELNLFIDGLVEIINIFQNTLQLIQYDNS
jgi:hypothetical protein